MKLSYRILGRLSVVLIAILSLWAGFFYYAILDEVNDETDDALEDYSETIIIRHLAGEVLPSHDNGSNNQYYLQEIPKEYAQRVPHIQYKDAMVYIEEKEETEPARILTTIFSDDDDRFYKLTVSIPAIEKHDLLVSIWYWVLFLYGSLLAMILGITWWVFRRSMRPLYILLHWLDQYTIGRRTPYHNPTSITEFKRLNDAVERSVQHNERIYEQQKQFIGNASHEIQTPIAVCENRIELLLEDETLSAHQMEELAKIHQTLEHISKLNRSLLLISKIENNQYPESTEIRMGDVFRRFLPDYQEVYAYKQIQVDLSEEQPCVVYLNETLATILVTNLLKNAFVHSPNQGAIHIIIKEKQFLISNSASPEQKPLDPELIFTRFYQGKQKQEGSTGLGLAIASTICRMYSFQLRYFYEKNQHFFEFSADSV